VKHCEEDVLRAVSAKLGARIAALYFRVKSLHGYSYIEVVFRCSEPVELRRVAEKLSEIGVRSELESRSSLVVRRLHDVRVLVEKLIGVDCLPPDVRACYEARYRGRSLPVSEELAPELKPLAEWLTNIGFRVVAGKYPQLRLTFTCPEMAREAARLLRSLGCSPVEGSGRSRTIGVYRLRDVKLIVEKLLDADKLPSSFLEAYSKAVKSLHAVYVDERRIVRRPEFWRIVGLVLGDNDTGLNSFSNTDRRLVELFVKKAASLFPQESVRVSRKVDRRRGRKPLWRVTVRGEPGRLLARIAEKAHTLVRELDPENFWQLVTGLYEADGSVSVRYPSATYRVPYPDVSIKLSGDQKALASVIAERLLAEGVDARVKLHSSCYEVRVTSKNGFKKFFSRVKPVVKNPRDPRSFEGTRTKPETAVLITTLFKELACEG